MKDQSDGYHYMNPSKNIPYFWQLLDDKHLSFHYLKHTNGLLYFHSKKPEFLKQEIYANLILYNFRIVLANKDAEEKQNVYAVKIEFRQFYRLLCGIGAIHFGYR